MKKYAVLFSLTLTCFTATQLNAQETVREAGKEVKEAGKDAGHAVKNGAKKAGRESKEVASKGKAKATDSVYKEKVGPNGEVVYIDNHSRYYWVDNNGRRHYVLASDLKDKN